MYNCLFLLRSPSTLAATAPCFKKRFLFFACNFLVSAILNVHTILISAPSDGVDETRGCNEVSYCRVSFLVRALFGFQGFCAPVSADCSQRRFLPPRPLPPPTFQTFEPEYINMLLKAYFLLIGTFAISMTFYPFVQHFGKVICE